MDLVSLQPLPLLSSLKHLLLYIRTEENLGESFCNDIGDLACLETLGMGREFSKYRRFRPEYYQGGQCAHAPTRPRLAGGGINTEHRAHG